MLMWFISGMVMIYVPYPQITPAQHRESLAPIPLKQCCAPGTFKVADDEPITFYDFMAITARSLGIGAPRRIPAALARIIAGGNAVDAVVRSARSSNAKIKRELGWRPRFPSAREGVADAVAGLGRP